MEVILKADKDYVGIVNEYTSRKNNTKKVSPKLIDYIVSIFGRDTYIEVTNSLVNIINMELSNLLLDRVCKKNAETIAREMRDYLIGENEEERKCVLS